MNLLEQKPVNETTTQISINAWGIVLIIVLTILAIVGVIFLLRHINKHIDTNEQGQLKEKTFPWGTFITIIILWSIIVIPIIYTIIVISI